MLKRLKNFLIFHSAAPLIWLLGRLPLGLLLALGPALGRLAWLMARRERRRALDNLRGALPDLEEAGRRLLAREVFDNLGRGAMECVALDRLRPLLAGPQSPVQFSPGSLEALQEALAEGAGVLFATAHLGNWELLGAAVARHAPLSVLFKPSYDPRFTRLITRFRARSGIRGLDVSRAGHMVQVLRALGAGEVVGVLVDQPAPGVRVPFFHQQAPTSTMVAELASRTGAAVVLGFMQRQGARRHTVSIRRMSLPQQHPRKATARLTREVEQAVRAAPSQWVWTLDRWREEPRPEALARHGQPGQPPEASGVRPPAAKEACQRNANCIPAGSV